MSQPARSVAIFLRPLVHLLHTCGMDPESLFARHGLALADTANPEARVAVQASSALLDDAEALLADPSLGINMARHGEYATFGALGLALAAGGSLHSVLQRITRFHRLISDVVSSELSQDDTGLAIHFSASGEHRPHPQAILFVMASIVRMLRIRVRPDLNPVAVRAPQVSAGFEQAMARYFRAPVQQAEDFSLHFDPASADAQLVASDPQLAAMLDATLTQRLAEEQKGSLVMQLSIWLEERLPEGEPGLGEAASRFHMSARSLQRRLGDEDLTWKQLLEKTRRVLVERHLHTPGMSITQLAFLLGFADVSSFSRAFRKWYGVSPSHYRNGK